MMEVQGVARARHDSFPYSGMRVLGCCHIVIGSVLFALGILDLVLTMVSYDSDKAKYGYRYDDVISFTVASSPLWCGMWFSVTGAIGTCFSRGRAHTLQFFKIVFLVLNLLCCALFAPICAVLNGIIAFTRHAIDSRDLHWLLSLAICFLSVIEILLAVATASVTCCCAYVRGTQVHVIVNPNGNITNITQRDGRSNDGTDGAQSFSHYQVNGNNNNSSSSNNNNNNYNESNNQNDNRRREDSAFNSNNLTPNDLDPDVETGRERNQKPRPRVEMDEDEVKDGFAGPYPQLKKWALPSW